MIRLAASVKDSWSPLQDEILPRHSKKEGSQPQSKKAKNAANGQAIRESKFIGKMTESAAEKPMDKPLQNNEQKFPAVQAPISEPVIAPSIAQAVHPAP